MKLLKIFFLSVISFAVSAQGFKVPTKSPLQTIKQEFGLSSIEIEYSRPSARGRVIFGDLEAFGKLWRTGANNQTTITFGDDVKVEGTPLKAGKYTILTVIGKKEWEIKFCTPETSVFNYDEANEIASIKVNSFRHPRKFETFTIIFGDQSDNSVEVNMIWQNTAVPFTVTTDIDEKVMASIDRVMTEDSRPYHAAASYYFDNDKDLKQALVWVNKAVEQQPDAFWVTYLKAQIQAKLGDKVGAVETANHSISQAKKAHNGDYVALNEKLIKSLE